VWRAARGQRGTADASAPPRAGVRRSRQASGCAGERQPHPRRGVDSRRRTMKLKVLIADDEQVARARLARLLSALEGIEVVGECDDGDAVLQRIRQGGVDVVLLDIQMPKLKGTEALALWPKDGPQVIFCTAHAQHAIEAF